MDINTVVRRVRLPANSSSLWSRENKWLLPDIGSELSTFCQSWAFHFIKSGWWGNSGFLFTGARLIDEIPTPNDWPTISLPPNLKMHKFLFDKKIGDSTERRFLMNNDFKLQKSNGWCVLWWFNIKCSSENTALFYKYFTTYKRVS